MTHGFQEAEDPFWMEGGQSCEGIPGLDIKIVCPIVTPLFAGLSHLRKYG